MGIEKAIVAPRLDCLTNSHLNEQVIWEILMNPTLFKADSQWLSENTQIAQTAPTIVLITTITIIVSINCHQCWCKYKCKNKDNNCNNHRYHCHYQYHHRLPLLIRQRRLLLLLLLLLYYWYYSYQEYLSKCTLLPFPIPQLPPLLLVYCCYYCCQCYCSSDTTNNPKHTELNNPPKKIFTSSKQITIYNNKPCQFSGHASNILQNHP